MYIHNGSGYFAPRVTIDPHDLVIHVLLPAVDETMAHFVPEVCLDSSFATQVGIYSPFRPIIYTYNLNSTIIQHFYLPTTFQTVVNAIFSFNLPHFQIIVRLTITKRFDIFRFFICLRFSQHHLFVFNYTLIFNFLR